MAGPVQLERVDLVSATPGTWLNHDVPMIGSYNTSVILRFVEQVEPIFVTPIEGWSVGLSVVSQSFYRQVELPGSLRAFGGVQSTLLLPSGVVAGVGGQWRRVSAGVGVSAFSGASWSHLDWTAWQALPTMSMGIAREAN